jgi:hypothetical protein
VRSGGIAKLKPKIKPALEQLLQRRKLLFSATSINTASEQIPGVLQKMQSKNTQMIQVAATDIFDIISPTSFFPDNGFI